MSGRATPDKLREVRMQVGFLLHDTARLMRKKFDQQAQQLSITRAQWRVLFNLERMPGISQARLADQLEIEPITLCRLVDRMEQAGWVRREACPDDRRVRRLHMTGQAQGILKELHVMADTLHAQTLAGLSPQALEQLLDTLAVMRENLADEGAERAG